MGALANAGLALQGANAAQQDYNTLETQKIGLDNLKRTNDTDEAVRQVAAAGGSHEDMALAAEKRGDYARALQHRQGGKALEDESIKNVIHKALIDPRPGDRPDLVEEANRYRKGGGMTSMNLDDKGNLTFSGAKSGTMNVGVAAERLGLVKPWEKEIPAGGMYVRGNPATGQTTTIRNDAMPKFELKDGILYNERTGQWQQMDTSGKWTLGKITQGNQEVPVAVNSSTGAVNLLGPGGVRTGLDAKITQPTTPGGQIMIAMPGGGVAEFKPSTEGTPAKTHLFSADEPAKPGEPAKLTPATIEAPPLQGARKAPDGNWYVPDPNNQGKFLQVVVQGAPGGAPAAAPAAAPGGAPLQVAKPAPAATPVKAEEEKLPDVVSAPGAGASPAERHRSRVAAARGEQDKAREMAPKQRAVETFRAIASSPRMTAEDAPLIKEAIATGLLTPAEKSKAEKMLAKLQPQSAGYADGGKVEEKTFGPATAKGEPIGYGDLADVTVNTGKGIARGIGKMLRGDAEGAKAEADKTVDQNREISRKAAERRRGYADGGVIQKVSRGIEMVGKAAEKGYARGGKVTRHGL